MNENFSQADLELDDNKDYGEVNTYTCLSCHTTFNSNNNSNKKCIFCGEDKISQVDLKRFDNYSYLPFTVSLNEACGLYKKKLRANLLAPLSFRSKKVINSIQKAYIPCVLYNMAVEGNTTFYGADTINNAPKQIFECVYSTHFDYSNLLSSNYSKVNDVSLSNINDYDFSGLSVFDPAIINDCCLIASDVENDEISEKVKERAINRCVNIVKENVKHEKKKLAENNLTLGVASAVHVMIPVYFMNCRYNGQDYLLVINGQTKKMILDLPISVLSIILLSIICFVVIFLISSGIALFI